MARSDQFNRNFDKPAAKYIEWSSDEKQFRYWDSEKEKDVFISLPLKFVVIQEMHTIRGFHDDSNSRIFSNEVEHLTETLTVKSFKGGNIAKGTYENIKETVKDAGGHYAKSIYIQTLKGEIWNINLKSSAVFAWGEFMKKHGKQLMNHSVTVTEAEELKKGKIDYSVPVFELGKEISKESFDKAEAAYDELWSKLSSRAQSLATKSEGGDDEEEENESKSKMLESLRKDKKKDKTKDIEETHDDDDFPDPDFPEEAEVGF